MSWSRTAMNERPSAVRNRLRAVSTASTARPAMIQYQTNSKLVRGHPPTEDGQPVDVEEALPAGEPAPAADHEDDDLLAGDRRDGQVEALEAQRRQAEERTRPPRSPARRRAWPAAPAARRAGPAAPEVNAPTARKPPWPSEIWPVNPTRMFRPTAPIDGDADGVDDAEPVGVDHPRQREQAGEDEHQPQPLGRRCAAAAVRRRSWCGRRRSRWRPCQTLSMRGWPNSPYGRSEQDQHQHDVRHDL